MRNKEVIWGLMIVIINDVVLGDWIMGFFLGLQLFLFDCEGFINGYVFVFKVYCWLLF